MRAIDADALIKWLDNYYDSEKFTVGHICNIVKDMPTIEPERKKGEWTKNNSCPFCGFLPWYERDIHTLSFCPNCGADMRGEQNED